MPERRLAERVGILEGKVTLLEDVPARVGAVEVQLVQLRGEMRDGFLALRAQVDAGDEETRRFMRVLIEDVIARIATIGEGRSRKRH
jgi:hypothetical protein